MGFQKFKTNIAWVDSQVVSETLPNAPISKVLLIHIAGSMSGGASGNYIANTIIQYVVLKINGSKMYEFNGDVDTDKVPNGIAMLRELNAQRAGVAPTNEYFTVHLPDALPTNVQVEVEFKFNSIANINDGDRTGYDGKLDILYETKDLVKGKVIVPYSNYSKHNMAGRTGKEIFYLPQSPTGFKLHYIIFKSEDNATASDTTFDNIKIYLPAKELFNGRFATMKDIQEGRSGLALSTGFAIFKIETPFVVPANTLAIEVEAGTAGTDKELHWLALYAKT